MLLRLLIIIPLVLIIFSCVKLSLCNNTLQWDASIGFMEYEKDIGLNNYKSVKNEQKSKYSDEFFDETVKKNRAYLDEKFKGHYIDRALSGGDIVRWNPDTFPLKVYIEDNPELPEYYYKAVKDAFLEWQKTSDDFITFKFINEKNAAAIRCIFSYNLNAGKDESYAAAGLTSPKFKDGMLDYVNIAFLPYNYYRPDEYVKEVHLHRIALHEIGHALGIHGHSADHFDIMYPTTANAKGISSNDINTIKLIYSIVPDITNKEFPQEVKDKFLTANDVFGNYDNRYKIELESIKDDIGNSENFTGYKAPRLGYLYYKTKQYSKARDTLETVIRKYPKERTAYATLAKVYRKQKDYEALENLYILAKKNFPDNPPIKKE